MTPEQLKASILQYAIQGKLVEQRPEEGNAEDLYKEIQEEKQKLIKAGKIKKEKPLAEITEDEMLFDIPDSWKWVRISTIGITQTGNTPKKSHPEYFGSDIPFLGPGDIQNGIINYENQGLSDEGKEYGRITPANSILQVCIGGSIGKCALVDREVAFNQQINSIYPLIANSEYVYHILDSSYFKNYMKDNAGGTATPIINRGLWDAIIIPLPPLAEQHRIVAKIEELLPYVDRYAVSYEKLEQFNAKFPEDMKKSILQYAIQGKLVEQRPEEGTAEELYNQICIDRENKIKAKLIKRDKRASLDDMEEEKPFDIPENWKWVTLGSILLKLTDGTHKTPKYSEQGIKFVSVKDMSSGVLSLDNTKFITEEEHKELYNRCDPQKGDMLLSKVGTTGVPAIIDTDEQFSLFVSVALLKYNHEYINEKYLYYLLLSPLVQKQASENTRGVGNKNWVLDAIGKTLITLPPYKEQERIVEELEKLLPYCDQLIK